MRGMIVTTIETPLETRRVVMRERWLWDTVTVECRNFGDERLHYGEWTVTLRDRVRRGRGEAVHDALVALLDRQLPRQRAGLPPAVTERRESP
jgi:hypothetical protein